MMRLPRRVKAVLFDFITRVAPTRPVGADDAARRDFSSHPGGKGLRFSERLRDAFRKGWLRLSR